ncbi:DUF262 domain-containing protein [Oerskovia jenensis]|uniref:GmrSD restriction endonucleases N-terminal domain-containing protein n=1 Tax=Oerskovia jenensis TaxID=162169 RepID=A0ABS2LFE7_9CELL|nr:DUF262 domain-containing protein [Oerskovia jenensis]MBM7479151.1 hypothetical protein [Oerskovia jenensis]
MAELDSQPKTLQTIYSWFSQNKLYVNRRYQRKLVWTLPEKQKLVSSVLRELPIPAVLLAEREGGAYEIIDGLQRLHTLMSFVETSFPTEEGDLFDVKRFLTAHERQKAVGFSKPAGEYGLLGAREIATFLDYPLSISIMRGASEAEVDDVFSRINTYGHLLSNQERRQAGVQGDFPKLVRELASELRGDVSEETLELAQMPMISIDLPKMKHGYAVQADQVFWVAQGILNGGNLRDSMDEQCVADIVASIVGGQILDSSKDALDSVYNAGDAESERISLALDSYGASRIKDEFKYCIQEVQNIAAAGGSEKLRKVLFRGSSNNPFPNVFTVLLIALHESLVTEKRTIADHAGVKRALANLSDRFDSSRKSTISDERRKNVNIVKGLIASSLVDGAPDGVYSNPSMIDLDAIIRRSQVETARYELKQGILALAESRDVNSSVMEKVIKTICGIANCGPEAGGVVLIGVADKPADVQRIAELDGVTPIQVGGRSVVGITREAGLLGETVEQYVGRWKHSIRNSGLSEPLRSEVLSAFDFNDYLGLGVLVLRVPVQRTLSYVDDRVYVRSHDDTVELTSPPEIAAAATRFR